MKYKIELITAFFGLANTLLALLSKNSIATIHPGISSVTYLVISNILLLLLAFYISFARKDNGYKYEPKTRVFSKGSIIAIPVLSFMLWLFALKLSPSEIQERDEYVKVGNLHLRGGRLEHALKNYEKALEIDPSQPDLIEKKEKIENQLINGN